MGDVKMQSSDKLRAKIERCRQELSDARKALKKAERLEELQRQEEERNQRIENALKMVDFMKTFQLKNGYTAYVWMENEMAKRKKAAETETTSVTTGSARTEENQNYRQA